MKTIKYLISANGVTPTHSVFGLMFHNKQSHVVIRGFGALFPILTYLPISELVNCGNFKDYTPTCEHV